MIQVSVIVPCYNEQGTIGYLLESLASQSYPISQMEIIIADGMSTDNTREVIDEFTARNPGLEIKIINNERRTIPSGLNAAIFNARGKFIVRLDAHSIPDRDYVKKCIQALENNLAENVGGIWIIKPRGESVIAKAIALAGSHPLAVGDAKYRYTNEPGYVDTVPFGSFHKNLIDLIGLFDETLLTNEDYEFNTRIKQAGGRIWLDPEIHSVYFAQDSISGLASQYWRYGYWKAKMLKKFPQSIRLRQAIPPLFVLSLIILLILALISGWAQLLLAIELSLYLILLFGIGVQVVIKNKDIRLLLTTPVVVATMHLAWGSAFIWSIIQSAVKKLSYG